MVYIQALYRMTRVRRTGLTVSRGVDSSPQYRLFSRFVEKSHSTKPNDVLRLCHVWLSHVFQKKNSLSLATCCFILMFFSLLNYNRAVSSTQCFSTRRSCARWQHSWRRCCYKSLYRRDPQKTVYFFYIASHKIIGSAVFILSECMGLTGTWTPRKAIYNPRMAVHFLPPLPPWLRWGEYQPLPPPCTALWEEFWWSDLIKNIEFKWKILQSSLAATWFCGYCGSHIIFICNISPLQYPLRKSKLSLFFGLSLCLFK